MVDYDAELRRYHEVLAAVWGVRPGDRVLDIGCGTGQTTRHAARLAAGGSVLGVDVSEPALELARRQAEDDGLRTVAFERADAQAHPFAGDRFDIAISRFGTMFFADPPAAFANIERALVPAGRLTMLVWQAKKDNEWAVAIERVFPTIGDGGGPNAFSLGEPDDTTALLHTTGFVDVTVAEVRQPVYYGSDVDTALAWVRGFSTTANALRQLDPPAAEHALDLLRKTMADHLGADGVWFDSAAWLVTARRS